MKHGARNQLSGNVVEIKRGTLMSQVKVEISGNSTISSVMTLDSLNDLGIKEGDEVKAMVKAINVLLVKDD